ncbi:MAG: NAD(P)H-dependent oxidoreductase [Lachnospiraceae bacterium]|nr:NAD(P)H-dependent oxidoreductase [Lachnospiraceae bacterium]MDE7332852.1 NAD(P)H-dependent oxidoreductase [Lachnospiraceae bacterium]
MNILVINGSPKGRASNTYRLTQAFLEGIKQALSEDADGKGKEDVGRENVSGVHVEELMVNRMEIQPCLGCFSCWNKTPGKCCIEDGMEEVIQKLLWADVTIWSFPLYYYTVPGGLKNMIDRQLPMCLPFMAEREDHVGNGSHPARYDMSGKKNVVISTCGFYTAEGNYDGVRSLFDHMCGRNSYTTIFCGQGELFRVPEVAKRTDEYLAYVRSAGREFARGGISGSTGKALEELLYPKEVFESMADASWGIDKESGEKETDTLTFTRQMAALYRKESYEGKELVVEMFYTDLDECYQIVLGKEGSRVLKDGFKEATTRIETPVTVWKSIAAGEIRGDEALMRHLYKVKGDFSLMINWDKYFGSYGRSADEAEEIQRAEGGKDGNGKGTNMNIMLIPWIVFWVAVPINGYAGSLAGIGACVLVPLLFYQYKKTFYDILTGVLVTGLSVAVLVGAPERIVLSLSYFVFGVMWAVSCLRKIPLTACYSMNNYGGEDALRNPLFVKTNRILTLLWGILYLLTPIWTYFLMGTGIGGFTGAVNSVLPVFMGIFTVWFQKWYPAKVAGG